MRLINADELKLEETARIQLGEMKEYFALISYSKKQIEEAPTVEAIPIEWLKENYGNLQIVRYIMKDWEIENE